MSSEPIKSLDFFLAFERLDDSDLFGPAAAVMTGCVDSQQMETLNEVFEPNKTTFFPTFALRQTRNALQMIDRGLSMTADGRCLSNRKSLYINHEATRTGLLHWVDNWNKNGWTTKSGKPVKNADVWSEAHTLLRANAIQLRITLPPGDVERNFEATRRIAIGLLDATKEGLVASSILQAASAPVLAGQGLW